MLWYESFDELMARELPGVRLERDVAMQKHTSFRIGGPARRMAFPETKEQLVRTAELAVACGIKPFVVGKGTNLLICDEGLDTLVIKTESMNAVRQLDEVTLEADAGISLARLAVFAQQQGLAGLEFAHGIPGSLGGAVYMNAGAYGGEMKDVLVEITALFDDGVRTLSVEDADLSYRHSLFADNNAVVLGAVVRLKQDEPAAIRERMDELMARRKKTQPLEYPSAGSTFKRPAGNFAGTLIEKTGLKGLTVGGAQVSEKHAGFLINIGGATAADVMELVAQVQQRVFDASGIMLEPEVRIIR